jgi:hypothetical protein
MEDPFVGFKNDTPWRGGRTHEVDRGKKPELPSIFVFHRAGFMLPGAHRVEPSANHPANCIGDL